MKTFKRFSAILIAVFLMVSMMVIPASAAGEYTITINGTAKDHSYEAYQIFSGDLANGILSNVVWGNGVNNKDLLNALQTSEYFGDRFKNCVTAADVAKVMEDKTTWFTADTDQFAKIVAVNLGTNAGSSTANETTYTIEVPAGYYFVKDVTESLAGNDAYTKYIIHVTSDIAVDVKSDLPKLAKEVYSPLDENYVEAISANIGDTVTFRLTGTLHGRVSDYDKYYLQFVDTLPAGLEYVEIASVSVGTTALTSDQMNQYVTVTNTEATTEDPATLTVTIKDAKKLVNNITGKAVTSSDYIRVTFSAKVTEKIDINAQEGNSNKAVLKYSNNPNGNNDIDAKDGENNPIPVSTGTTPEAIAKVYTYQLTLNKVDATDTTKKLSGAVFTLYRIVGSAQEYAIVDTNGFITGWTEDKDDATPLTTDSNGVVSVKGVAKGSYHLTETTAPAGYNKINDVIEVEFSASFDKNTGSVTGFSGSITGGAGNASLVSANADTGNVTLQVRNTKGSVLPETGGIGTTIFYGIGGLLVIGALSLLIVRKRTTAK